MILSRIYKFFVRKKNARKFGIRFSGSSNFKLPEKIILNGKWESVSFPNEHGIKVAFIELLLDDCYCCMEVKKPIKTILDIGSNVGLFGLSARKFFPGATIHSYEPNKSLEPFIKINSLAANSKYFLQAVGKVNGWVNLITESESVLTRSALNQYGNTKQTSLRNAIKKIGGWVDFLKIDCEGAEWDMFDDYSIWKSVGYLSMEYHLLDIHSRMEIENKVKDLGFTILKHKPSHGFGLIFASRFPK
jgi:FkbM family methyltransferase